MTLEEFREDLINEIKSQSLIDSDYTTDVFTEYCKDILITMNSFVNLSREAYSPEDIMAIKNCMKQ